MAFEKEEKRLGFVYIRICRHPLAPRVVPTTEGIEVTFFIIFHSVVHFTYNFFFFLFLSLDMLRLNPWTHTASSIYRLKYI